MELKVEEMKEGRAIPELGLCRGCVPTSAAEQRGVTAVTAGKMLFSFLARRPVQTILGWSR
jgi:hypothetical protein